MIEGEIPIYRKLEIRRIGKIEKIFDQVDGLDWTHDKVVIRGRMKDMEEKEKKKKKSIFIEDAYLIFKLKIKINEIFLKIKTFENQR